MRVDAVVDGTIQITLDRTEARALKDLILEAVPRGTTPAAVERWHYLTKMAQPLIIKLAIALGSSPGTRGA